MNSYWIGIAAGIFIGACFGFFLCALMVTAKRGDRQMGIPEVQDECPETKEINWVKVALLNSKILTKRR